MLGYRGSHAHGMFVPKNDPNSIDDIDLMGVYIAPIEHYFGFGKKDVKDKFIGEWDVVSYELKKFIGLLVNFNPNVVSLLWIDESDYIYLNDFGRELRKQRTIFNSKKAYHTFTGYAHGQLEKMNRLDVEVIKRIDLCVEALKGEGVTFGIHGEPVNVPAGLSFYGQETLRYYGEYRKKYFSGYMGERRKNLVKQFGYDTKNAAHLVRLLRMSVEFLDTGILNVRRNDSEELLSIKQGKWSLEAVKAEAERLFAKAREAKDRSKLPEEANYEAAEQLCVKLLSLQHNLNIRYDRVWA